MKINKKLAAVVAAAVAVGGLGALGLTSSAQAATVTLFGGINDTNLQGTQAYGSNTVSLTLTPTSGPVNSALQVDISTNLQVNSGPASASSPYGTRLDAVINYNGNDYLIAGSRATVSTPASTPPPTTFSIFDGGAETSVISSDPATNSVSTGTAVGTVGEGVFALTGASAGSPTTLSIPSVGSASPGTAYTVKVKAIVANSVSNYAPPCATPGPCSPVYPGTGGTGTNSIGDGFDLIFSQLNPSAPYASTAAVNGNIITGTVNAIGPNAAISSVTGLTATNALRLPIAAGGYTDNPVNIALTGTTWANNVTLGGFTASFCDVSGVTCDVPVKFDVTNTLVTNPSGALTGNVVVNRNGTPSSGAGLTTGSRAIKLVQGSNNYLVPILVLGTPAVTASPTSGGPGTVVTAAGSDFNPGEPVVARGGLAGASNFSFTWAVTGDAATAAVNANSTGAVSIPFTVQATDTANIFLLQNNTTGSYATNNAQTQRAFTSFFVNQDRCIAQAADTTGGAGCNTKQNVNVSVLQGQLVQRAYTNSTPTTGSTNSAATTPVAGTSNVNSNATTINLGTITTPLAPTAIVGNLNDITVSDNRGGTFGWTLSATMPSLTSTTLGTIANTAAVVTSTCAAAITGTAWDYTAVGQTPISGFDASLSASGASAGATAAALGTQINLCTKNTTTNATTGSTGGVYNVGGTITLTVPAFQKAGAYSTTMTITLV
jgi:hypothetical protein